MASPDFCRLEAARGKNLCPGGPSDNSFTSTSGDAPSIVATAHAKALTASKNHSEAERRRRGRINGHLATLKKLLPHTTKVDKASILAEVIEHIKGLKEQVAEISKFCPVPSEVDELNVHIDRPGKLLKASICCEDRPGLLSDLVKTLGTLHLETVKAEMATLEGRTKNVFLMTTRQEQTTLDEHTLACVEEALKTVMEGAKPKLQSPKSSRDK